MKRKFLAGLLSLCIMFSLFPTAVFAEEVTTPAEQPEVVVCEAAEDCQATEHKAECAKYEAPTEEPTEEPAGENPTVVASVFSSLLSLCLCLSLFLQPLATLSAFFASLSPPRPPHLPITPPGPSLALRPRDWVWGASQPGLGALSGRQWCRRPLELRPSRGPEQSQRGLKTPSRPKPQVPPR